MMQTTDSINLDDFPDVYYGAYANIHRESHNTSSIGTQYAYKTFRAVPSDMVAVSQFNAMIDGLLLRQSPGNGLEFSRISPVLAANASIKGTPVPTIKLPWYRNANILIYLSNNVDADKATLVMDIAHGLASLHSHGIIHGNLYPGNVLITDDCRARISDIGIYASVIQIIHADHFPIPSQWPFKSPEELMSGVRTSQTDVYSFACTVYSMYTGGLLFKNSTHAYPRCIEKIIERGHAVIFGNSKPAEMGGQLWDLLGRCWAINPAQRPTMMEVVEELSALGPDSD